MVVQTVTVFQNCPFAPDGLLASMDSCMNERDLCAPAGMRYHAMFIAYSISRPVSAYTTSRLHYSGRHAVFYYLLFQEASSQFAPQHDTVFKPETACYEFPLKTHWTKTAFCRAKITKLCLHPDSLNVRRLKVTMKQEDFSRFSQDPDIACLLTFQSDRDESPSWTAFVVCSRSQE